jgi:hypothetical protein
MSCRVCESHRLLSVLDLGATPPCEKFLPNEALDLVEATYPLHLRVWENCLLLQLPALITPEETFTEYAYFSSYSDSWVAHAGRFVESAVERLKLNENSFVVEVASNDGYLLKHVVDAGVRCLGIEPSVNVSAAAVERGLPTLTAFLDEATATAVRAEHGTPWRPLVHAVDIARAFAVCLEVPAETISCRAYNVGTEANNLTVAQIADTVCTTVPGSELLITGEHGADPRSYRIDFSRARAELGFEAHWSVADGAAELHAAYTSNGLTKEDFEQKFTRLARLEALRSGAALDETMRRVSAAV